MKADNSKHLQSSIWFLRGKEDIMAGYILLEGGAEFGGRMAEPDRRAIALAGGPAAPISIIPSIGRSRLIYLLGGFTGYLGETLKNSASWQAMLSAYEAGAVIAGSSAGAMVLCQYYYDPGKRQLVEGLNLLPNTCVLPHHNTFGKNWAAQLSQLLPQAILLGIDERTGMLDDDGSKTGWHVYGQGAVTVYRNGQPTIYGTGASFTDDFS